MSEAPVTPEPGPSAEPGSPSPRPEPTSAPASPEPATPPAAPAAPAAPRFRDTIPGLSPDVLAHPALENVKDVADLASQFVNLQSVIGRKTVATPQEGATQEEWNQFYAELGRPEQPDGYAFVNDLDESLRANADGILKPMLETFHEAGLSEKQAAAVVQKYLASANSTVEAQHAAAAEARSTAEQTLRQQWGSAYDVKIGAAAEAAESLFGENLQQFNQIQLSDGSYLGDNPLMVQLLAALGESVDEGTVHPGGQRATLTPEEATAELQGLMADPNFVEAYKNRDHPQHKAVLDRRLQLRRMMNPDAKPTDLYAPKL